MKKQDTKIYKNKENNKSIKTSFSGIVKRKKAKNDSEIYKFDPLKKDIDNNIYNLEDRDEDSLLKNYDSGSDVELKNKNMKVKINNKNIKLSSILKEVFEENSEPIAKLTKDEKGNHLSTIFEFSALGKNVYRENNLIETANRLAEIVDLSEKLILDQSKEWFDTISIKENMKQLKSISSQFEKVATDTQRLQERLTVLYEDCGHILGRYFEIKD